MAITEDESGGLHVEFHNADEVVEFSEIIVEGRKIYMIYDRFECRIEAELSEDGRMMSGKWMKSTGDFASKGSFPVRQT
jgi:hypothetical protein